MAAARQTGQVQYKTFSPEPQKKWPGHFEHKATITHVQPWTNKMAPTQLSKAISPKNGLNLHLSYSDGAFSNPIIPKTIATQFMKAMKVTDVTQLIGKKILAHHAGIDDAHAKTNGPIVAISPYRPEAKSGKQK